MADTPEVLFVCVHNAGRSQMAAALLDHHAWGTVRVRSAGSAPADRLNPAVSRPWPSGASTCPGRPQAAHRRLGQGRRRGRHHGLRGRLPGLPGQALRGLGAPGSAGQPVEVVRRIRDDIDGRVRRLLDELVPSASA